ncbi:coiled-coil domain-containing protein 6 [Aphelenchoides avenae]|nr:coiled-coil domain-containing protein 6 [Aphelenchus avenae]
MGPGLEHKLDLAMVPVISDQLLFDIVNKERTYEQIDVHLFAKNEQLKAKVAQLEATNKQIRETTVKMQARVEQEEEYISNMLLKRIQKLKNDKESLALKYEQEEEFLTNDLSRKLSQLEGERDELVAKLSQEQSWVVNNLLAKIRKLEMEIQSNRKSLDQLRKEKIDLENSLEHEQEALFNTLGKRMDQLEAEKRRMQTRLETRDSRGSRDASPAPMPPQSPIEGTSSSHVFASPQNIRFPSGDRSIDPHGEDEVLLLKAQVSRLRSNVSTLNSRVAQLEREKREGKANYQKFTSLIRKKPIPDYKEFLDFLEQLEPRDCSSASDSGLSHMTLPSPAHSDDAMPSASGGV